MQCVRTSTTASGRLKSCFLVAERLQNYMLWVDIFVVPWMLIVDDFFWRELLQNEKNSHVYCCRFSGSNVWNYSSCIFNTNCSMNFANCLIPVPRRKNKSIDFCFYWFFLFIFQWPSNDFSVIFKLIFSDLSVTFKFWKEFFFCIRVSFF